MSKFSAAMVAQPGTCEPAAELSAQTSLKAKQQPVNKVITTIVETLEANLPRLVEAAVAQRLASLTKSFEEMSTTMTSLMETVQELAKAVKPDNFRTVEPLTNFIPTLRYKGLTMNDVTSLRNMKPEALLGIFKKAGKPYNHIVGYKIQDKTKGTNPHAALSDRLELLLYLDTQQSFVQLTRKEMSIYTMKLLKLSNRAHLMTEKYWVHDFHLLDLNKVETKSFKDRVTEWNSQTGLKISEIDFKCGRLLLGFDNPNEAEKACTSVFYIDGSPNRAVCPEYPRDGLANTDKFKCLFCARIHAGVCHFKNDPSGQECLNCLREGVFPRNHNTESQACQNAAVKLHRIKCKTFLACGPQWARGRNIPLNPIIPFDHPSDTGMQAKRGPGRPKGNATNNGNNMTSVEDKLLPMDEMDFVNPEDTTQPGDKDKGKAKAGSSESAPIVVDDEDYGYSSSDDTFGSFAELSLDHEETSQSTVRSSNSTFHTQSTLPSSQSVASSSQISPTRSMLDVLKPYSDEPTKEKKKSAPKSTEKSTQAAKKTATPKGKEKATQPEKPKPAAPEKKTKNSKKAPLPSVEDREPTDSTANTPEQTPTGQKRKRVDAKAKQSRVAEATDAAAGDTAAEHLSDQEPPARRVRIRPGRGPRPATATVIKKEPSNIEIPMTPDDSPFAPDVSKKRNLANPFENKSGRASTVVVPATPEESQLVCAASSAFGNGVETIDLTAELTDASMSESEVEETEFFDDLYPDDD
ncbi:uncharacterized protein J4E87_007574 [Alternaria ethzedia]|uniref:uncharacterized protein n=1 Tax=Alternaria ethzedia TaxID=181014 RepID=UPI0020C2CE4C|nr:uncharacterized protein J4E87_007574 [Alternaria ethzedia]KAI4619324.1 hypothetical protein J4E87_007574 [Alternaria ethzedia]